MRNSGIPWIGDIPKDWTVCFIKQIMRNKSIKGYPDEMVLSLYRDYGVVPKDSRDDNHNVTSEDTSSYKFVEVGDFVINKMKAWQGSMAVSDYQGIISPAYYICRFINNEIDRKYIHYLLRNDTYKAEYMRLSSGMRVGQWDLNIDDFLRIKMVLPSLSEQQKIASFLDRKCAEIDEMIALQEKIVEELKAYKQSVITEAVTKGLNPDVPMKNSGVDWIGDIPEHWELSKMKPLTKLITDGTHQTPDYVDEGVPFLSIKDISSGKIDFSDAKYITEEAHQQLSKHAPIERGDVIFTRIGTMGVFVKVDTNQVFDIFVSVGLIKLKEHSINTDYFVYYMSSHNVLNYITQVKAGGGTSAAKFNLGDVARTIILLPNEEEQKVIVSYLNSKCTEIDSLINIKLSKIDSLKEYKKSIIYEYVTGKKEVTD